MIRRLVLQLDDLLNSLAACRTCIGRRILNITTDLAGQTVGIREVRGRTRLIGFLDYDLGYFDNERGRVEPGPNSFDPDKVLTMCPEQGVNHVTG
jgi:putative transposase